MDNTEKIVLQVKMMGGFSCRANGKSLEFAGATGAKLVQLFMYLLYSYPQPLPLSSVTEALYSDADVDMNNSFKALLFRLRGAMSSELKIPQHECIILRGGMLRLSDRFEVHSDIADFNAEYKRATEAATEDERLKALESVFKTYTGGLLPMIASTSWVIFENAVISDKYIRAVNKLCQCYNNRKDYEKVYNTYKRAMISFPYEEDWMIGCIDSLTAQKKYRQAMVEYEEMTGSIFDEMGMYPSERLLDVMRRINEELSSSVSEASDIRDSLAEENVLGAYYCSFPNFVNTYHILERIMKRDCIDSTMVLITVTDKNGVPLEDGADIVAAIPRLHMAISKTLRRSDMYTRYSRTQMLVLLWRSGKENVSVIVDRLKKYIEEDAGTSACGISCKVLAEGSTPAPIAGQQGTFGSIGSRKGRLLK